MYKALLTLVLIVALPASITAGQTYVSTLDPHTFTFHGASFGHPPEPAMICVHGQCLQDGRVTLPYSTFQRQPTRASIAGVPITGPRFNYWENQLFRVSFHINVPFEDEEESIGYVLNHLSQVLSLTRLKEEKKHLVHGDVKLQTTTYISPEGAVVMVVRCTIGDRRELPTVFLFNKRVKDQIAKVSNPEFQPKPLLVPTHLLQKSHV